MVFGLSLWCGRGLRPECAMELLKGGLVGLSPSLLHEGRFPRHGFVPCGGQEMLALGLKTLLMLWLLCAGA